MPGCAIISIARSPTTPPRGAGSGAGSGAAPDLYVPLHARDQLVPGEPRWDRPFTRLGLMGRLRDGVTRDEAQAELDTLLQQAADERAARDGVARLS
jgi:hypothetical protein